MAKRPKLDIAAEAGLFKRTEPTTPVQPAKQPKPISVKLTADELQELESIVEDSGINRHALLRYAIRYFVKDYKAGKIRKITKQVTDLEEL